MDQKVELSYHQGIIWLVRAQHLYFLLAYGGFLSFLLAPPATPCEDDELMFFQ